MKFRSLLTTALLVATPSLGLAEAKVRTITLDECIQEAFENNLEIKILRYSPELAELNLTGSYAAYDPTYSFGYDASRARVPRQPEINSLRIPENINWNQGYDMRLGGLLPTGASYQLFGGLDANRSRFGFEDATFQNGVSASTGVSLTQPLLRNLWIDQARWAIALNKRTILQEEQAVRSQLIQTATDVQVAYYNMAASRENVTVQTKAVELAERLLVENRKRVEVGAMAPLESQQAEAQVATSRADLISAQQNYGTAQNNLRRLLTSDYSDIADVTFVPGEKFVPQPYPFNRAESWSRGLTMRPDIVQSQVEMEKQNITVRFRRNQLFPQLDLVSSFGLAANSATINSTNGNFNTGYNLDQALGQLGNADFRNYGVGARFSFPLGNRGAVSSFRSAKVVREQLILRHKQLEQSIMVAVDNAILVAQSAYERIQATRQARIYAEAALDAEQKKLENGKSTTFEVLRLQRDLTTARSDEVRALLDYYAALAVLFQGEGSTLERLGIRITAR
ncbi:MAG: TolC family protein [Verrucomicrobia bacterium]|nr:TolC family protein [Verrucomicrobiota bacterium]